jgi:hypothetical protein
MRFHFSRSWPSLQIRFCSLRAAIPGRDFRLSVVSRWYLFELWSPSYAEISFCVLACSFVQHTVFHFPLILIISRTVFHQRHGQILSSSNDFSCTVIFPWQSVLSAKCSEFPLLVSARSARPVFPCPGRSPLGVARFVRCLSGFCFRLGFLLAFFFSRSCVSITAGTRTTPPVTDFSVRK